VVGVLFGAIGWIIVRRSSKDPEALLRKLVPAVVVISFILDLAMLVSDYAPHSDAVGVVALLVMHVVVAAATVFAFRKVLPLGTPE
jgi:amino acid transporter